MGTGSPRFAGFPVFAGFGSRKSTPARILLSPLSTFFFLSFWLISVDWYFSLCCSSMLISCRFFVSFRFCFLSASFKVGQSSCFQSIRYNSIHFLSPIHVPAKAFENEAQVQKIDWRNICLDLLINEVHTGRPINCRIRGAINSVSWGKADGFVAGGLGGKY